MAVKLRKPLSKMSEEEQKAQTFYAQNWTFDDTKLCQTLDYRPRHTLQQTLEDIAQSSQVD